ncbi:MAG: hypothetical protein ABI763_03220 [Bacteroidota bacterium]
MLLYVAIISFILSNIISLALLFTGKKLGAGWFRMLASLHIVFAVLFLFNLITNKEESPRYLSFLVFFCSGIITGGLALGTQTSLFLKIYFGIFCLSVFVFIVSPSSMLNFLLTANFAQHSDLIPVRANYYLEKQSSTFSGDDKQVEYKLIEKNGMFHRTIIRELNFNGKLDSIKVLSFEESKTAIVRGYSSSKSFVEDKMDSIDLTIDLNPQKKDQIERKL